MAEAHIIAHARRKNTMAEAHIIVDGFPDLDHVLTFPLFEKFVKLFVQ
jgi:hypothetical protein